MIVVMEVMMGVISETGDDYDCVEIFEIFVTNGIWSHHSLLTSSSSSKRWQWNWCKSVGSILYSSSGSIVYSGSITYNRSSSTRIKERFAPPPSRTSRRMNKCIAVVYNSNRRSGTTCLYYMSMMKVFCSGVSVVL